MEAIARCISGLEFATLEELDLLLGIKGQIVLPGFVLFKVKTQQELADFTYKTRSALSVYQLFSHFEFKDFQDLKNTFKKLKLNLEEPFAVTCERSGTHDFNSQEIEKSLGEIIFTNSHLKVNLQEPKHLLLLDIIDRHCFVGLDYTGFKLNKREYRIKTHSQSLNPCLAYSLLKFSDWKEKESFIDPFCRSGEIVIEAALSALEIPGGINLEDKFQFTKFIEYQFTSKPKPKKLTIHCLDHLHLNLRNAEVNAKLANVAAFINFSRMDVEWLDTKFEKESIDKIITVLPSISRTLTEKEAEKLYKEFFYQTTYILKKKGTINLLTKNLPLTQKTAEAHSLKPSKKLSFEQGKEQLHFLIYTK